MENFQTHTKRETLPVISEPSEVWKIATRMEMETTEGDLNVEKCCGRIALPVVQLAPYSTPVFSLLPPVAMETDSSSARDEQDVVAFLKRFVESRRKQNCSVPLLGASKSRENFLRSQMSLTRGEEALNRGRKRNGLPEEFTNEPIYIQAIKPVQIVSSRKETPRESKQLPHERVRMRGRKHASVVKLKHGKTLSTGARRVCTPFPNLVLRPWSDGDDEGPLESGPLPADEPRYLQAGCVLYPPHHGL